MFSSASNTLIQDVMRLPALAELGGGADFRRPLRSDQRGCGGTGRATPSSPRNPLWTLPSPPEGDRNG